MVPALASRRLSWPSSMLAQVGVLASSKSAMNTLAPEFSALMIILRSTGPVISTRRSWMSAAAVQSASRIDFVSARKSGFQPASIRAWTSRRLASITATGAEAALQVGHERHGLGGQHGLEAGLHRPRDRDAGNACEIIHPHAPLDRRPSRTVGCRIVEKSGGCAARRRDRQGERPPVC
jgi:hypothetical protein